ncbi:hypothetical protein [Chryseolinea lacunae]|uniref:DUF4410 domain-containing protein n=1 Tax=Chryseolinea lacunae TaxID=2801331 RepID=A0ABS1KQ05_9BACT|nr:hypothetical protein [Chryseolinea lacunae]MBL0741297.1 hypothetical protein [Chryseolinea lacunae]
MKKIFLIACLALSLTGYSQKIKLIDGDLSPLKGVKGVSTEFEYDKMSVGKFDTEPEYVAQKIKDYNAKEPGQGDKWAVKWKEDRKDRFEPQFRELFSETSGISTVDEKSPYTLIFKTTKTEPGYNIGISRANAYIDAEAWIVDAKDHSKVIARISITKSPGRTAMGYDFETGTRIQEAYAKAGKELGAFIKKALK